MSGYATEAAGPGNRRPLQNREEAESAVRQVLQDEPRLVGDVFVAEIELEDPSLLSGHRHGAPPGVGSFR